MNAARLLALYERIAEAPDAVARLRRFVLDLAVRGKLVAQDARDEPASRMMAKLGQIRRRGGGDSCDDLKGRDAPYALPESWAWVRVGDAFQYDAGAKRDPKSLDPNGWLLELEDIEKDTGKLLERVRVRERLSLSTKSEFRAGDILYGKLRPYLNKVLVADEQGYSTTEIVAIRPLMLCSAAYCALAFRRPDFVEYVERLGRGTKMPRLRTPDAVNALFPLPPLAEQHRIVAKVDELMALCDRLEAARTAREATRDRLAAASLARLNTPDPETFPSDARFALDALPALTTRPDQIKHLRQTILNLAVRGKLVAQNPNDEPATKLLERIGLEKARATPKAGRGRRSEARPRTEAISFDAPRGWVLSCLGEVALKITDGAHHTPTYVAWGVPFVSVKDFSGGRLDLSNTKFITEDEHRELYQRCDPRRGDILIGRIGTLGRAVLVDTDREFSLFVSVGLIRFSHATLVPEYLRYLLNSPFVEAEFNRIKIGGGTHTNKLNLGDLHTVGLPIPPLAEQHRIVTKVNALLALCDALEASLADATTARTRLLEATLAEALAPAKAMAHDAAA
ncbi:MAG TPA: restriction endonuclease subunit S [Roseococcus sp.]|jgi:type I restriction enzyme S subunit|nr:restriction endonuclease subunit S [Roseococcus sp.]